MEQEADKLVRTYIKKIGVESPGQDFLQSVMSKIEVKSDLAPVLIKNEVLISLKGWFLIGMVVLSLSGMVFFIDKDSQIPVLIQFDTQILQNYFSIFMSRIFVVGMVIMALFVLLHTWMISRKLDAWYLRHKHHM
ncbi:MAG: hypothetical protein IPN79_03945 [Saprospiraceae bacterium]|nr:hypothetical protein [Saprospiraceae bacterium]